MLKKMDALIEWIANWILVITGIAVCVLIFSGAVMRYVLRTDFYGSEELILVAAFWMYFIGSAMAAKHNTQIKAEMLEMFIKNPKIHCEICYKPFYGNYRQYLVYPICNLEHQYECQV